VRYENVTGTGFLEMWNYFDDGGQYFSRTLDTSGAMQMVSGTSKERDFILPFHTGGKTSAPSRLEINLVLNGSGTVEIGPLELVSMNPLMSGAGAWFDITTAGLLGAAIGTLIGLAGALIGTLIGIGKGKVLVMVTASIMLAVGIAILAAGIVAVTQQQPFAINLVLFLSGGMCLLFGSLSLGIAPVRYRVLELRRMQALDG
jgi:hypothetical protein